VIANRALQHLGSRPGDYATVHPIDDVNLHQSTNDTYPTALKVAAILEIRMLESSVTALVEAFQRKERELAGVVKVGRTELQDAVLTTVGRAMGAFAEAFARDRWRIYKCEERLRVVNLGGTAIGTGLGAPRQYIFRVLDHLQQITGIGLARAENLIDATQNADVFVEVSGMVRALAASLLKISNDLRLLSSGPSAGLCELKLPAMQAGSSIMPGKVNPVIPEAVAQAALAISAGDQALMNACSLGNLELNQFYPLIADSLLGNLDLARNACSVFGDRCVAGIVADEESCRKSVGAATATVTALVDRIGYEAASEVAHEAQKTGKPIRETVLERKLMSGAEFDQAISPECVTRLGSVKE
jgi:aspartate ammonia-lyase